MDDLVARLREDWCHCLDVYKRMGRADPQCASCDTKDERHEAADAIERLRAENAALLEEHARMLGVMKAATGYMLELQNHAAWTCLESTIAAIDAARKAEQPRGE